MKNRKYVFGIFYILGIFGTAPSYTKQYGGSIFSLAGIIDCFVVPLIGAAVFTAVVSIGVRIFKKFKKTSE
jgi:hypothetical protein